MKPLDSDYVEQHDIAQQYLQGTLTPLESEAFEVYLMDHPEQIEALEIDKVFMDNAEVIKTSDKHNEGLKESFWQRLLVRPFTIGVGTALTCVMCFTLVLQLGLLPVREADIGSGAAKLVYLEAKRSSQLNGPEVIHLDTREKVLILAVSISGSLEREYHVNIKRADGDTVFKFTGIGNEYGDVVVSVPTESLSTGVYELEASSTQGTKSSLMTAFEVIAM
jgi:hypothetical protein